MAPSPSAAAPQTPASRTHATVIVLLLCMAAALALRVWMIADDGLWLDEGYSVWLAAQPFAQMLERIVTTDQHPPLYYALLWLWRWGGDSETYLRLLSTLFGVLTIPALFWLGRRLLGTPAGLVAALLLTVSPFNIRYAQEVRMYALLMLLATLALLCLAGWLTTPQNGYAKSGEFQPGPTQKRKDARGWWAAGYVVCTWLMLLTHNTAIFLPIAANIFVIGWLLVARWRDYGRNDRQPGHGEDTPYGHDMSCPYNHGENARSGHDMSCPSIRPLVRPAPRPWLVAQAALLLLWLLWLPAFLQQSAQVYARFWIAAPSAQTMADALQNLLSAQRPDVAPWPALLWLAAGASLVLGMAALRRAPALLALLAVLAVTPFVGELLVSLRRPIFAERTLIWTLIPLWLLMAAGITRSRPRLVGGVLLAALLTINLLSVQNYYATFRREEWRTAAAYLAARAAPGDLVLFHTPWVQLPFAYYLRRARSDLVLQSTPLPLFDNNQLEPLVTPDQLGNIVTAVGDRQRVWLVYSHFWYSDPENLVPQQLRQILPRCKEQQFFWDIAVQLCRAR